jgi:hypothetical protein
MRKTNGRLVVLVLAAVAAPACGGGSGECSPTCGPAFECYYGACVPRGPDSGVDGTVEGDGAADVPLHDDASIDRGSDTHAEGGACSVPEDCVDGDPCTEDFCDSGTGSCGHSIAFDGAPCPDGICCTGECRVGADCCTDAQCLGGCRGTARSCTELPAGSCSEQGGCTGTGESYCDGRGSPCYDVDLSSCEACGCSILVGTMLSCIGLSRPDCTRFDLELCEDCGCTWHAGCEGVHEDCNTSVDQVTCDSQLDCYWSTCLDHRCT